MFVAAPCKHTFVVAPRKQLIVAVPRHKWLSNITMLWVYVFSIVKGLCYCFVRSIQSTMENITKNQILKDFFFVFRSFNFELLGYEDFHL